MNIAIFHNFMDNIGGAEIVTLTLARELHGDIYTTNINADHIKEMGFGDVLSRMYSIGKIPIRAPFRQQMCFYRFWRLNLKKMIETGSIKKLKNLSGVSSDKKYDHYIIAGDWAMSGAVHNKPNLWYVHSPLHELWAFKDKIRNTMVVFWKRPIYDLWVWFNRKLTLSYAKHVGVITCNSLNTKERIKKYYGRDATVVNPPIETHNFKFETIGDYWLSVNRIVRHKRIKIQTEAFKNLPDEKLIIVGSYEKDAPQFEQYKDEIQKTMSSNVEIRSWVSNAELTHLYANCKGFITTSEAEDFGMTAVEAMASGKPVIAPKEGGYMETIIDGATGVLIDHIDAEKLTEAVRKISSELRDTRNIERYRLNSISHSQNFDVSIFIRKIKSFLV